MTKTVKTPLPKVMTIAGSDSGGGAGVQADIKTLTSLHVYATSVITALTSQNTLGVDGIHEVPAEFVVKQIASVLSDIGSDAIKIGMLCSANIIKAVSDALKQFPEGSRCIVLDPVMISTSGSHLLAVDALYVLVKELLPLTYILTPNVPEAELLLDKSPGSIKTLQDMKDAAEQLSKFGPKFVLLKGGHLPLSLKDKKKVIDVLYDSHGSVWHEVVNDYVDTKNTHGTGCTLSSAIAAELAKGEKAQNACRNAIEYVKLAIADSLVGIGSGNGPVNHFHSLKWSPYQGKTFIEAAKESLPEKLWSEFTYHPFVQGIADGSLPKEAFIYYLKQDYLYLQHYARAAALAAYKSNTMEAIGGNASIALHIAKESQLHLDYCARWGVTKDDILSTPESVFNSAYSRYVLDKGQSGDILDLKAAMMPCLLGYGEIGLRLFNDTKTKRDGNPYWSWICQYAADDFQVAVKVGLQELELLAETYISTSATRFKDVCMTFEQATRLEIKFWEMGLEMC